MNYYKYNANTDFRPYRNRSRDRNARSRSRDRLPERNRYFNTGSDSRERGRPTQQNVLRVNDPYLSANQGLGETVPLQISAPTVYTHPTDAIEEFVKTVCQAYPEERINDLAWLLNEFNTPLAHPISYCVPYSCLPENTCMVHNHLFAPNMKEQPTIVINSIIAMEIALPTRQTVLTADSVPHFASTITVQLWARLGELSWSAVPFNYAHNRTSRTEEDCEFVYPAVTGYINNVFMYKAEYHAWSMDAARAEIVEKCIEFNFMNHGKMTAIPVCVAAGTYMQFGLLDLRTNAFFAGYEYDVREPTQRARAVHASLKVFKMIASIAALKLPEPAIPWFRAIG